MNDECPQCVDYRTLIEIAIEDLEIEAKYLEGIEYGDFENVPTPLADVIRLLRRAL